MAFGREELCLWITTGAARGEVVLRPAVGRLWLGGGAAPGNLIEGSVGEGSHLQVRREMAVSGDTARCRLAAEYRDAWFLYPWSIGDPHWELRLGEEVPVRLRVELGAGDRVDLRLKGGVGEIRVEAE